MIRRLRIKFILASMLSLFSVLVLILVTSTAVSYRRLVVQADEVLGTLEYNGGVFPNDFFLSSPELPFESRYFSVRIGSDDSLIEADMDKIAAVDRDTAVRYAREILEGGKSQGFVGSYRFHVQDTAEGQRIIFLDCGRTLRDFKAFIISCITVSAFGMAAVMVLIVFFSKRIVYPAAESYEKQRRFITDAGHEIKTPLAIISADADVLEMDIGINEWVADIKHQTKRLTDLTNDLISLSRMEEDNSAIQMERLSFSDLAEHVQASFQSMAIVQDKVFKAEITPQLYVLGDKKALERLLSVILDNAIKYCPVGGEVTISLSRTGRQVRFEVTNTAENVNPSELGKLFDRFYRADPSRNSKTGGYGIGLSIASAIVAAHKGKISASTKDGKSMTMTVLLASA